MAHGVNDQRSLWPGYVYPNWYAGPSAPWLQWADYAPVGRDRSGSVAVMNPASGPGTAVNQDWTAAVNYARSRGHSIVGYTHTSYGDRPVAEVQAEVDAYYAWYNLDGIFVDEMSNDIADASYYRGVYSYAKTKAASVLVVGNPGAAAATDWQVKNPRSADLLVIHENTAAAYLTWTPPTWTANYQPSTFAHLVHSCPAGDLAAVLAHAETHRAGYRYVTPDVLPNPYDTLGYWPQQATP